MLILVTAAATRQAVFTNTDNVTNTSPRSPKTLSKAPLVFARSSSAWTARRSRSRSDCHGRWRRAESVQCSERHQRQRFPQQQLLAALEAIRARAVACEYVMLTTAKGKIDRFGGYRLRFRLGRTCRRNPEGRRRPECRLATGGFYYDDTNPKRIVLCPSSYDAVKGAQQAKLDVELGCITPVH